MNLQVDLLECLEAGSVGLGEIGYGNDGLQGQAASSRLRANPRTVAPVPSSWDTTCRPTLLLAPVTRIMLFVSSQRRLLRARSSCGRVARPPARLPAPEYGSSRRPQIQPRAASPGDRRSARRRSPSGKRGPPRRCRGRARAPCTRTCRWSRRYPKIALARTAGSHLLAKTGPAE